MRDFLWIKVTSLYQTVIYMPFPTHYRPSVACILTTCKKNHILPWDLEKDHSWRGFYHRLLLRFCFEYEPQLQLHYIWEKTKFPSWESPVGLKELKTKVRNMAQPAVLTNWKLTNVRTKFTSQGWAVFMVVLSSNRHTPSKVTLKTNIHTRTHTPHTHTHTHTYILKYSKTAFILKQHSHFLI